jgi:hypothetical protein
MAKLFWVCVVVTTSLGTKPKLVSLNKYTQCITQPRIETSRLVPSTEQSQLSPCTIRDQVLGNGVYVCISMLNLKVAELDIRARVSSSTKVRSGPQSPESRSRNLCPLGWR